MARREMIIHVVDCAKFGQEMMALDKPPFGGELGERIFNNVSKQAWAMWPKQATLIINHYGLNMADPRANELLFKQMEEFFFGEGSHKPEGWVAETATPTNE